MPQPLDYLPETASQTAGPFVLIGLAPRVAGFRPFETELGREIAPEGVPGERIAMEGVVLDGNGAPVKDAMLEVWQPDAEGRWADGSGPFRGWGRVPTDLATGEWVFETVKPGASPGHGGTVQAPHIAVWIVARGINIGLQTRIYFPDEDNAADPVLSRIEPHRRATLLASALAPGRYRFEIRLQGPGETVFLDM